MKITIPGPKPPANAVSVCDEIRKFYPRALLLVLAVRHKGVLENVRTVVLFGTGRLRVQPDKTVVDRPKTSRILLYRHMIENSADADAFVAAARSGTVNLPSSPFYVKYRLDSWWEGFLPQSSTDGSEGPSGTVSVWRRRRQATTPMVLGKPVTRTTIVSILEALPETSEYDWALLDPSADASALDGLDELYPIPVSLGINHQGNALNAVVTDPDGWLPQFKNASIRVDGWRFDLRQRSATIAIPGPGNYSIALHEPFTEGTLEAEGIPLDSFAVTYFGITQSVPPISGGSLPSVYDLAALAKRVRESKDKKGLFITDSSARGGAPIASDVQDLIAAKVSKHAPTTVDVIDTYVVDATAIRMIAGALPKGSVIRVACNKPSADGDFPALEVATGVRILRYKIPGSHMVHDRFMRIGDTVWLSGGSFKDLGQRYSVIAELTDLTVAHMVSAMFDLCYRGRIMAKSS